MKRSEAVYLRLPRPLRSAAVGYAGLRTVRTRYAPPFPELYRAAVDRSTWPAERVAEYRDARLRAFVRHAVATVPYYRELFGRLGAEPGDIRTLDDLARLPVLTRADAQALGSALRSPAPCDHVHVATTSGSTGTSVEVWTCRRAVQELWATYWRYCGWHGIERGTPCALFAGRHVVPATQRRPPFWHYSPATRQIVVSGWHMRPETMPAYVDLLRRRRPPWLHGYASLISLLASHVAAERIDLGYQVRWVTVCSETLLPHQRTAIEQAFGVSPREHYANTECAANISECELGSLHVDEDFAAVELVGDGHGGPVRLVGTNFVNPVMPLLRYDLGDVVEIGDSCACGRPGRVVASIDGRVDDYVVLDDGTRIGRVSHVFKGQRRLREAQIVQEEAGRVVFRLVVSSGWTAADEESLLATVRTMLGDRLVVRVEYVDALERTRTGKLRLVRSTAEGGRLPAVTWSGGTGEEEDRARAS